MAAQEPQDPEYHPPRIDESFRFNARLDEIERRQREEQKEEREYKRRQLRFDGLMVLFTCLLFLTSAVSNLISLSQTRAAIRSADAAAVAAKAAQDGVIESQKNRTASEIQSREALDASIALAHNEQRAWIIVPSKYGLIDFVNNGPVSYQIAFTNTGKTPASVVDAIVRAQIIESGKDPDFRYPQGTSDSYVVGELVPNNEEQPAYLQARNAGSPIILTTYQVERIRAGLDYIAVYGNVTYRDIAGQHWMKFCRAAYTGERKKGKTPNKCGQYNTSGDGEAQPNFR